MLKFRKATIRDLEDIIKLCDECFDEKTNLKKAKDIYKKTRRDKNNIYLVGMLDEKIVAHAKVTIIPTIYQNMGTYAIVNHFCVDPDFRRNGIASKMLKEIHSICKENKCKTIELWSKNFRKAAHACYKKNGYELQDAGYFVKKV